MAADRANRIGGALTRKIGPLPAAVWLGFVGVAAYLYQHRKGAGAQQPPVVPQGPSSYYSTIGGSSSTYNLYGPRPTTSSPPNAPVGRSDRPPPPMCGPGQSPVWTGTGWTCQPSGHVRGPLPPEPIPPPPNMGPERPGGGDHAIELPVIGAVPAPRTIGLPVLNLRAVGGGGGDELPVAQAGQRATARRATIRPALRAAQQATENAPGLVGLEGLKAPQAGRDRSPMPPAPALRQRPAAPRVTDPEVQRNVKNRAHAR